jgi:hypothetical protein
MMSSDRQTSGVSISMRPDLPVDPTALFGHCLAVFAGTKTKTYVFFLCLTLAAFLNAKAQSTSPPTNHKETLVTHHAAGPFDVKTTPQDDKTGDATLGRFLLDKQYHGDLEATARGQMLTAGTAVKGSAGYVAIERVTGTLKGRTGSFVLQHTGTMTQGAPHLVITVVPDSGTDQLVGIAGKLTIIFAPGGKHSYDLEYTLPN